jgi:hypothetical protein
VIEEEEYASHRKEVRLSDLECTCLLCHASNDDQQKCYSRDVHLFFLAPPSEKQYAPGELSAMSHLAGGVIVRSPCMKSGCTAPKDIQDCTGMMRHRTDVHSEEDVKS